MSLLTEAKSQPRKTKNSSNEIGSKLRKEILELAIAYSKGEVYTAQCQKVLVGLGFKSASNGVQTIFAQRILSALRSGEYKIVKK